MGYARAADMIALVGEQAALQDHLRHNLFPPVVDPAAAEVATRAIEAVADDRGDDIVGSNHRGNLTAAEVVEGLRLDAFVEARMGETEVIV